MRREKSGLLWKDEREKLGRTSKSSIQERPVQWMDYLNNIVQLVLRKEAVVQVQVYREVHAYETCHYLLR